MNKHFSLLMIFGTLLISSCKTSNYTPADQLVYSTLWFQKSDEMKVIFAQSYERASYLLKLNLKNNTHPQPAVILDIDETVLDNSPYEARLVQQGESYQPESWAAWVEEARAEPLPGALTFTQEARKLGVEIFYVSNRDASQLAPTIRNLREKGFPNAEEQYVLLKTHSSDKTDRREKIKADHAVLLLVGDQLGDFTEDYELDSDSLMQHFILLPNPMYGSFEQRAYEGQRSLNDDEKALMRKKFLRTE